MRNGLDAHLAQAADLEAVAAEVADVADPTMGTERWRATYYATFTALQRVKQEAASGALEIPPQDVLDSLGVAMTSGHGKRTQHVLDWLAAAIRALAAAKETT